MRQEFIYIDIAIIEIYDYQSKEFINQPINYEDFFMSMNITQLNNLATQLESANTSLSVSDKGDLQVNSSFGQKVAAFFSGRDTNRAVVQNLINTMKSAPEFTDTQKSAADRLLKSALESGKPLNSRVAAQAIREFVAIKTNEDAYKAATKTINATELADKMFAKIGDNPPEFETLLDNFLEGTGLTRAEVSAEEMADLKTKCKDEMVALANNPAGRNAMAQRAGLDAPDTSKSMDRQEATTSFNKSFNHFFHMKLQNDSTALMAGKVSHTSPTDALPTRLAELATAKGISTPIKPENMDFLVKKINASFKLFCAPIDPQAKVQAPTQAKADEIRDRILDRFLDSMKAVDDSALSTEQKHFAKVVISSSEMLFTPIMAKSLCDSADTMVGHIIDFTTNPNMPADQAAQKLEQFTDDLLTFSGNPEVFGQEFGADEKQVMREAIGKLAFATCSMIDLENPDVNFNENSFNKFAGPGSALNAAIYDKQAELRARDDDGESSYTFRGQNLVSIQTMLSSLGHDSAIGFMDERSLGSLSTVQAESRLGAHPQGIDLDVYKQKVFASFNSSLSKAQTCPTYEIHIPEEIQQRADAGDAKAKGLVDSAKLINQFSEQFMKDFFRTPITVNGEKVGGGGTNNFEHMVGEFNNLIKHFPNIETAKQVLNPFHQGIGGDAMIAGGKTPGLADDFAERMTKAHVNQSQQHSITSNPDGSYTCTYDYFQESLDHGDKFASNIYAVNLIAQFSVTPQAGQADANWTVSHANMFYSNVVNG